jgi:archaetidylinositol phosphate synthase
MFFAGLCYLAGALEQIHAAGGDAMARGQLAGRQSGTLARVRNRQRPRYGFYVDHITGAFGTCFLVGGRGYPVT